MAAMPLLFVKQDKRHGKDLELKGWELCHQVDCQTKYTDTPTAPSQPVLSSVSPNFSGMDKEAHIRSLDFGEK